MGDVLSPNTNSFETIFERTNIHLTGKPAPSLARCFSCVISWPALCLNGHLSLHPLLQTGTESLNVPMKVTGREKSEGAWQVTECAFSQLLKLCFSKANVFK